MSTRDIFVLTCYVLSYLNYCTREDKLFLITLLFLLIITCVNRRLIQREIGFNWRHLSREISNFQLFSFQSCWNWLIDAVDRYIPDASRFPS